ncbi:MAG: hypothetical protein WDA65_05025 [Christensenellales bacterium]
MSKNIKKLIIIVGIVIILCVTLIIWFLQYVSYEMRTLPEEAEYFFNENSDKLNGFVNICFDNSINYIATQENIEQPDNKPYNVGGYYVYMDYKISHELEKDLSNILGLLRRNNISSIHVDTNNQTVTMFMQRFLACTAIKYMIEAQSIEKIKDDYYTNNAKYIDQNWVIITLE